MNKSKSQRESLENGPLRRHSSNQAMLKRIRQGIEKMPIRYEGDPYIVTIPREKELF